MAQQKDRREEYSSAGFVNSILINNQRLTDMGIIKYI
jgi:hypothetical protein